MAYDYSSLVTTASAQIAQFGQSVSIERPGSGTSDPAAGTYTQAPTTVSATAALVGINEQNSPGALIEAGDMLALTDTLIAPQDVLIVGAVRWQVIAVNEVNPGGTPLLYKAQVRR